tara:strand:- start:31 stop:492 length:462 start_codon:yes stop_codon:yes gene_type:complete
MANYRESKPLGTSPKFDGPGDGKKKTKKKKVNSGNPLIDKAIIASNKRKAADKKKANLGPIKGGAKTIAEKSRLSYLTKAADSQVKKKKQGDQNKRDKKTVSDGRIDVIINKINKGVLPGYAEDFLTPAQKKRISAAKAAQKRLDKNKKKKTR